MVETDIVGIIINTIKDFITLYRWEITTLALIIGAVYWVITQKLKMDGVKR